MRELQPGLWHWQAPHPEWSAESTWPQEVSSYAVELGDDIVLFDPLSVPDELRERATAVVLTAPYHERDARRLGVSPVRPVGSGRCRFGHLAASSVNAICASSGASGAPRQ